jgi:putative Ca2+/H+ antiporter (TMEM165/GDT1 family)
VREGDNVAWLTYITTYLVIVLAEMGDKTQLATLLLSSNNPRHRWGVYAASALALTLCVALEVTVGTTLGRHLSPRFFNQFTGWVFLVLAAFSFGTWWRERRTTPQPDRRPQRLEIPARAHHVRETP